MKVSPRTRVILLAGFLLVLFNYRGFAQCSTPTNLIVNNLTSTSGSFDWSSVSGATSYILKVRPTGSSTWRRISSSNSSETVTGLLPNTNYEAKVRSDCGGIEGNYTSYMYFTTLSNNPCQIPNVYYFTSNDKTANSCRVGWRTISGANSYYVRYKVRYSSAAWINLPASTNSLQLTGLSPLTQYEFQVQTVCSGGSSAFSSSGIFTTTNSGCGAPANLLVANVTTSSAILKWSPVNCAMRYEVDHRRSGQLWTTDTTSLSQYPLSQLTQATNYEFRVRSVSSDGTASASSVIYSFTAGSGACGQPASLVASTVSTNGATLTWNAVPSATYYNVRYRLAGASSWQTLTANGTSTVIGGLSPDNAYEFQVQSICPSGPGSYSSTSTFITSILQTSNIPVPDHIVICILENKAYTQLIGSSLTPHINALANDPKTAVFIESYGITHPSQPNYIHLFSGASQGVTDNNLITTKFTTPNLAHELINAGRTFATYSQGLPSVGFDGYSSGKYRRRHNPVTNWMGTGTNQVPSTVNQPFTNFPTDFNNLSTVSFVVPDLDNGMHDGTLGTALALGDNWVFNNLNAYIQWAKTNNSLFILTTDEDDGAHSNRILTMMTGQPVNGGHYSQPINHYNLIRTIAEMYGLNFIGGSANVSAFHGCWTNNFREAAPGPVAEQITAPSVDMSRWKIYPNPSRGEVHIAFELVDEADVAVKIFNSTGALVHEKKFGKMSKGRKVYDLPSDLKMAVGVYFATITYGDKKYVQRFLISE